VTGLRFLLVMACVLVQSCAEASSIETVHVSLQSAETFQYPTVGGDEEGARIATQATHYSISEFRRNAATNWVAVYVYRPASGFVGSDYAELEISTGSDGASPPTSVKKVALRFAIHH